MAGVKGRSGRRPDPLKLVELKHGEAEAERRRADEPKPDLLTSCPKPMAPLSRDARREWDRIAPELVKLHLLSGLDLAALMGYCRAFGAAAEAERDIAKRGRYVLSREKVRVLNPAVRDSYRAHEVMRQFLIEFGMSPSSRSRVTKGGGGVSPNETQRPPATNRFGAAV